MTVTVICTLCGYSGNAHEAGSPACVADTIARIESLEAALREIPKAPDWMASRIALAALAPAKPTGEPEVVLESSGPISTVEELEEFLGPVPGQEEPPKGGQIDEG